MQADLLIGWSQLKAGQKERSLSSLDNSYYFFFG